MLPSRPHTTITTITHLHDHHPHPHQLAPFLPSTAGAAALPFDGVGAAKGAAMAAGVALAYRLRDQALAASGCLLGATMVVEHAWPVALRAGRWVDETVVPRVHLAPRRRIAFDQALAAAKEVAGASADHLSANAEAA